MFNLQSLAVQLLLRYAFPGYDKAPGGAHIIVTHHLLQRIFGLLLLSHDDFQLSTGFSAIQIRRHEGVFLALEELHSVADLNPSTYELQLTQLRAVCVGHIPGGH